MAGPGGTASRTALAIGRAMPSTASSCSMRWARSWAAALAAAVVVMGGHYPSPPMSDLVLSEDHGPVRHVVLNRPEKRNAFHDELVLATGTALRAAADDPAVRVVVVRGAGPLFSSGMDLGSLAALSAAPEHLRTFRRALPRGVEPGRGDAQAGHLRDPRRVHRRRARAGARVRLPRARRRRGRRDARDADRADPRRRRLLAAPAGRRARAGEGARDDRQADRRGGGRADRPRDARRAGRGARRRRRRSSWTSCWRARRWRWRWPSG